LSGAAAPMEIRWAMTEPHRDSVQSPHSRLKKECQAAKKESLLAQLPQQIWAEFCIVAGVRIAARELAAWMLYISLLCALEDCL
jgi:hypothetical protein